MATLFDTAGAEIGRASVHGIFHGADSHSPGTALNLTNPIRYILRFEGDASRVKKGGDYRVDFGDGKTVLVRVSRVDRVQENWMLHCDVIEPGVKA